jgi:hypothetical protein
MNPQSTRVGAPAAPAANGTVTLFNSATQLAGGLAANGVERVRFDFAGLDQASAVDGLKGYKSPDGGDNWYANTFSAVGSVAALPTTVTAQTATDGFSVDIYVGTAGDVKFTFTAGDLAPTVFKPVITLLSGEAHSGE